MTETRKGLLIDPSRCIGCRSCQVACKQWNKLSVEQARGKTQEQLTPSLFNRIRSVESADASGNVILRFVSQRCMHCGEAGCMKVCPAPGALYRTKEGFVAWNRDKCISCKYCVSACPFNVPRFDGDDRITKCHACSSRITAGMAPACAKACPTQSIRYGERDALISSAKGVKGKVLYGETSLSGLGIVYALEGRPEEYGLPEKPAIPLSIFLWKDVVKPLGILGFWGSLGAMLLHYVTVGPKRVEDEGEEDTRGGKGNG